ncbi:hypothetical protein FVB32_14130 [Flagellimonas hymeniacidonis]|uniref:Caspase domain-containing protein n=1 Tax=Flagellimonas hymeniacidonis TaxID=2603628 RepID=A0A5C8V5B2_9FLAO|nr:hypothetical protein [Flagellimonas hymeniacidonis]TXN35707.1 hypothetical protein FVB32_14130 [Flagellimonas hymeniacidonis]
MDKAISEELFKLNLKGEPSVVLFFFIGHGLYIENDDFYIVTSNAKKNSGRDLFGINRDFLRHINGFLKKSHVLTFIDACSSGEIENLPFLDNMRRTWKDNGVLHYMLTSTTDARPSYGAYFSKSLLEFIRDKGKGAGKDCDLDFSYVNSTKAIIPYMRKVYLDAGKDTTELSIKKFEPIFTFSSDKFCLDSFRGIKGCGVIQNNKEIDVSCVIKNPGGKILINKELKPNEYLWFFGKLGIDYSINYSWYDSRMKEERNKKDKFNFTSENPVSELFLEGKANYSIRYADLLFQSSKAAEMIGVREEFITTRLAQAKFIERISKIADDGDYAYVERIDTLLKQSDSRVANNWSKRNGEWYVVESGDATINFKGKIRQLFAEGDFKKASLLSHDLYLRSGEKENLELSRDMELAFLTADLTRKEDSIQTYYNSADLPWVAVTENAITRLSPIPELQSVSDKSTVELIMKLTDIKTKVTEKIVAWIEENNAGYINLKKE